MQRERRVNRPGSASYFPKVSLFTRVARTRRVSARHSGCAGAAHVSEFIYNVIPIPRAVAARPPGARAKELCARDADPEQAIPTVLKGRDLLGIAQTGTGKTAAFMLPSIDRLRAVATAAPRPRACRMLVLAPTRELASQIAESARAYSRFSQLAVATVFGGTSIGKNRQDVARGVDVLVATPGRLIDLIEQRYLTLREVEILVLDEADQMLDLGFIHALKQIVRMLPAKRQTLFFSATMPKAIQRAGRPVPDRSGRRSRSRRPATTVERVDQYVTFVQQAEKQALLTMMLRVGFSEQRQDGPRAHLHPHQARRRPGREAARRQRHRRQRHPRQQEPAAARARARRVQGRPGRRSWSRPTSPRAASTSRASAT